MYAHTDNGSSVVMIILAQASTQGAETLCAYNNATMMQYPLTRTRPVATSDGNFRAGTRVEASAIPSSGFTIHWHTLPSRSSCKPRLHSTFQYACCALYCYFVRCAWHTCFNTRRFVLGALCWHALPEPHSWCLEDACKCFQL